MRAQSDKSIIATVSYLTTYVKDGKTLVDDISVLDVTKTQSYFYSKALNEYKIKAQDVFDRAKATGSRPAIDVRDYKIGKTYAGYSLKNYNEKNAISIQVVGSQTFGYVKYPDGYKRWKIFGDTLTINNLKCQKAELKVDEGIVTAWFCKDIPLQDGPYSFFGLPGLIVNLQCTDGWAATFMGITYAGNDAAKQLGVVKYTLISKIDFMKAVENSRATRANGLSAPGMSIQKKQN